MAGAKVNKIIFVTDEGNDVGEYIPASVLNMIEVIKRTERGKLYPSSWVMRQSRCQSSNGKMLRHPAIMPYRMKCSVDGSERVVFGHPEDIKAKKAEYDKAGIRYRD